MKIHFILPLFLFFLLPVKIQGTTSSEFNSSCDRFLAGEIDAFKTLEDLELNLHNYSIGVNNTAKIFCT